MRDTDFYNSSPEQRSTMWADSLEHLSNAIQHIMVEEKHPWITLFPRGPFELGAGLEKTFKRFHDGQAERVGLNRWEAIQISRPDSHPDGGFDACDFNPYIVEGGIQTIAYSGLKTERATKWLCITDFKYFWEMMQQISFKLAELARYRIQVDDNFNKEMSLKMASDAGRIYVLTNGAPTTVTATYDPLVVDADGDTTITTTSSDEISTINWKHFEYISRDIETDAAGAAIGDLGGRPQLGFLGDMADWDDFKDRNPDVLENFRFAQPMVNIQQYGNVFSYKGYALMHLPKASRLTIKSKTSTQTVFKFVDNLREVAVDANLGVRLETNPEYMSAEYGIAHIITRHGMSIEIPPDLVNLGGMSFTPNMPLEGNFVWFNDPNQPFGKKGRYCAEFERFVKPGMYDYKMTAVIYKRCPQMNAIDCDPDSEEAASSPVTVTVNAAAGIALVGSSTTEVTVTLPTSIDRESPESVTIQVDGGTSYSAYISSSSGAPTYIFSLAAADAAAVVAASASLIISW